MTVHELNRDELTELKQSYMCEHVEEYGEISWEDLSNVDLYVTDNDVFEEYAHVTFVKEDFFSNI